MEAEKKMLSGAEVQKVFGVSRRTWEKSTKMPDFPSKNPLTGRWKREEIETFLRKYDLI